MKALSDALDTFRCCKDEDIETFLRCKALEYIERGWCSVYLVLNKEAFMAGDIEVEAYFTLSHKALIPEGASLSKIKDAGGFKDADTVHFVLIGQLGKHMEALAGGSITAAHISSAEILDFAFEVVRASSYLIPCRCALVECSSEKKVQKVYTDYGFKFFQNDGEHHQFYKRI